MLYGWNGIKIIIIKREQETKGACCESELFILDNEPGFLVQGI